MEQPKIPTLKDSQKPQVKIKGLAAGMSLFDRLKTFKKKDLAFILAGLGTLFMAPLAEHFMMAPESGDGTMQQGWGGKGGSNLFGSGSSPYESGITGLAPGGAIGGGGDVITPLNVRDPSALVMGPGATQQPPAGSLAPQTPPPSSAKEPDLKDALANAAARAAGAATRRAPVPVPKPAMTGSGLRGLGVASGGSSAGAGLAPINSAGLSTNKAAGSNSLGDVRPTSNYRGVARGPGKGGGGSEALKAAAGGAGDLFNRGGSAAGNAEQAAQVAMPGGNAFGGGNGGAGGADKGPGGNNSNGSKSVGESLEFLRQKQEMEKALDLKWKMKEKRAMFPLELQQEAAKTIVMDGVVKPLAGMFGDLMKSAFPGATSNIVCNSPRRIAVKVSDIVSENACNTQKDGGKYTYSNGNLRACGNQGVTYTQCSISNGAASDTGTETAEERARREAGNNPFSGVTPERRQAMGRADAACTALRGGAGLQGTQQKEAEMLNAQAREVVRARNSLSGGAQSCGADTVTPGASADGQLGEAEAQLGNALSKLNQQNATGTAYARPDTEINKVAAAITEAERLIGAAKTALDTPVGVPPLAPQAPKAYFAQTSNPFSGRGDAESWFTQFKEAHGPLAGTITEMEGRLGRLKAVAGEVNLLAGEAGKQGVVERSIQANIAYTNAKTVADAAEGEPARTAYNTAKAAIQGAPPVLRADAPAGTGAVDPVRATVTQFIGNSQTTAQKVTAADQALMRYAGAPGAPTTPLTAPATPKSEATRLVTELGTAVGTSMETDGLRKSAGALVQTVITNVNNSRTGPQQRQ